MAEKIVFVTGGTGFLGKHLVRHLDDQGFRVRMLVRQTSELEWLEGRDVELIFGDVSDGYALQKGMQKCNYVVHAAGHFRFWGPWNKFRAVNTFGTELICNLALVNNIERLLYISTIVVIGDPGPGELITEKTLPRPMDGYQHSKLGAEKVVLNMVENQGLPAFIFRPGAFYGPGSRYGFNRLFVEEPLRGWRVRVNRGRRLTFPVFVPDVAKMICAGLQKGRVGEIYNISDRSITHNEVNNIVSSILGISSWRLSVPQAIMIGLAGVMEVVAMLTKQEPFYPLNLRHYVFNDWEVSSEKACQELGFEPTPLEQGLRQTVAWYKKMFTAR
jgi:dihydroflavonol-4-reductase